MEFTVLWPCPCRAPHWGPLCFLWLENSADLSEFTSSAQLSLLCYPSPLRWSPRPLRCLRVPLCCMHPLPYMLIFNMHPLPYMLCRFFCLPHSKDTHPSVEYFLAYGLILSIIKMRKSTFMDQSLLFLSSLLLLSLNSLSSGPKVSYFLASTVTSE